MDMYYYVVCVTNLIVMATMATIYIYMVNVMNKLQIREEKEHDISHFYNIYYR